MKNLLNSRNKLIVGWLSLIMLVSVYIINSTPTIEPVQNLSAFEIRKQKIDNQFSAWNGAHKNLQQRIKESAGDPESYEHIKTVYWDKSDHLVVETTYRVKNGFGALVLDSIKVKTDLDGEVLGLVE